VYSISAFGHLLVHAKTFGQGVVDKRKNTTNSKSIAYYFRLDIFNSLLFVMVSMDSTPTV